MGGWWVSPGTTDPRHEVCTSILMSQLFDVSALFPCGYFVNLSSAAQGSEPKIKVRVDWLFVYCCSLYWLHFKQYHWQYRGETCAVINGKSRQCLCILRQALLASTPFQAWARPFTVCPAGWGLQTFRAKHDAKMAHCGERISQLQCKRSALCWWSNISHEISNRV